TPYQFAGNRPIIAIDLDGLEPLDVNGKITGDPNEIHSYRVQPGQGFTQISEDLAKIGYVLDWKSIVMLNLEYVSHFKRDAMNKWDYRHTKLNMNPGNVLNLVPLIKETGLTQEPQLVPEGGFSDKNGVVLTTLQGNNNDPGGNSGSGANTMNIDNGWFGWLANIFPGAAAPPTVGGELLQNKEFREEVTWRKVNESTKPPEIAPNRKKREDRLFNKYIPNDSRGRGSLHGDVNTEGDSIFYMFRPDKNGNKWRVSETGPNLSDPIKVEKLKTK
ncbi:MAG: hypothetical protein JJT94_17290, partial [Bernardetiaceae bacterium]|nr:hypothetical protein [Bernardetiaceae bacterium]